MAEDNWAPKKEPKNTASNKAKLAYDTIGKNFSAKLLAFIEDQKNQWKIIPKNKNELIALFFQEIKKKDVALVQEYESYLVHISGQTSVDNITFEHLKDLPLGREGRLSELFATWQAENFEVNKQETVFSIRKNHYTAAIAETKDRTLQEKWKELCAWRFWKDWIKKLVRNRQLLPLLQKLFDGFFREHCNHKTQKVISTYLQDDAHRPTMKTYLDAFAEAWEDIRNNNIKNALLKDQKVKGKTITKGALSLGNTLEQLTNITLLEQGILARDAKKSLIESFDDTFSHTHSIGAIFTHLPREQYIIETKLSNSLSSRYQASIKNAKTEEEADTYRQQYEKELLIGYLERANKTLQKTAKNTPTVKLIEHLTALSKLTWSAFKTQITALKTTITTYLQEDYLEQQINHDMIKEQMKEFWIDAEKHFPAYLVFWKQVYDLDSKKAVFIKDGKEFTLTFLDKQIITHENRFRSIDRLDNLFSFERTIDFSRSDPLFSTLFWPTPQAYILDDKTWATLDTLQQGEFSIYMWEPVLKNRLILSKKNTITITDKTNWTTYTWYPMFEDTSEDNEQPWEAMHNPSTIDLQLTDDEGKPIWPSITLETIPWKPLPNWKLSHQEVLMQIDPTKWDITVTSRTFSHPQKPPIVHNFIQTALFNEMDPKEKIPTKSVYQQADVLDEAYPNEPHFSAYVKDDYSDDEDVIEWNADNENTASVEQEIRRAKLSSYKFVSSKDIPQGVIEEAKRRVPPRTKEQIKAWIDQGEIFFNVDYFCKTYWFQSIVLKDNELHFTDLDVTTQTSKDIYKNPKIRACIEELISAKTHETAHRLFHFHGIDHITTTTKTWKNITLDQETLCEIADGKSIERQRDGESKKRYVTIDGKEVWLESIEEKIGEKISWFSRRAIKRLDAAHLEEYTNDYEKFTDLLVANTANDNQTAPPTVQTVQSSRQAMSRRLQNYLDQIDVNFDPANTEQVQQRATAQQHLDTLNQQEQLLTDNTSPSETELANMHQQHIDAAQFLQQQATNRQQPWRQQQTNNQQESNQQENTPQPTNNQEQSTPPQENTSQPATTPQEPEVTSETEREEFKKGFDSLKGDAGAPLAAGTAIFLKEQISEIPGRGFNRVKYTITWMTDSEVFMELSDATEKQVSQKQPVRIPRTWYGINKLKKIGKNEIYKLWKEVATKSWFMNSISNTLWGKRAEVDNFKKKVTEDDKTSKEAVTHVGNLKEKISTFDSAESVLYKVDRWSTWVTLSAAVPDGNKRDEERKSLRTKKMDYDTFQMFCFTKWLNPLTSTEVKRSWERLDPKSIVSDWLPRQPLSLAAIWKWLKAIPEAYKKKFEEEQEFQTALATDYFSNRIPNTSFLFLDEIKGDLWWTDGLVRNRIQKFKSEWAATGDGDKASVHDNPISENIKAGVFENIGSSRRYKYKAAWALLYALEKGWPYFRALSEYANKDGWGRWIKCILGESARQQFLEERQRKVDQYKSMWWAADELQSEIVKFELQFLQDATQDKVGWWSKFWREIEANKDALYWWANSLDPSWFSKKGDFPYMLDAFEWWGINQNLPWVLMSSLEAMKWAVESPEHYSDFYMAILQIFATGMVHMLPQDYVNKLKGIGRSRGIPITLLAGDAHASGKAMKILDHIARNAHIKTFTQFSWFELNEFDEMHIHNYDMDKRKKIRNSFKNWWSNYWWTIMDAFNYKNEHLISIPDEQTETTRIVTDYLWWGWVFGGYKGIQDNDSVGQIDGQSPFFQEWLLNLSEWSFRSYMMRFNQWQLVNEHSASMWSSFSSILDQFQTNVNSSGNEKANHVMTQLLYKKFIKFFEQELWWTAGHTEPEARRWRSYKELFNAAIRGEISLEQLVRKSIFKEKERTDNRTEEIYITHEQISNGLVKDTILQFAWLVKQSYEKLELPGHKADIFNE